MSEFKSTEKVGPSTGFDFGSITNITQIISAAFQLPQEPVTPLPPPLVMVGGSMRTGLSSKQIAARVISRQSEAGAPYGDIWGDGENPMEGVITIICEEVVYSLQNESKVDVVVPPGIPLTAIGAGNFGAPVVSQGYTTSYKQANGIIR
jgi:hypothetical protein